MLVTYVRVEESIICSLQGLWENGTYLPSEACFRTHWTKDNGFWDVALFKESGDSGGGTFRMICNPINVEKPHALEHTRPVCEFSEVKDTAHNLRVACSTEGSVLRSGMEALMYR